MLAAPVISWLGWADNAGVRAAAAGGVTFVATLWWRPCIGSELGAILSASRSGLVAQLPGITAYVLGAMVPVLAIVLIIRIIDPMPPRAQVVSRVAGLLGLVVAGALAIGRHDDLVTALTRWTTS